MRTFIGVECIAANALIELYEDGIQEISFSQLADFGLSVVEQYNRENHTEAVLIFNPEDIHGMVVLIKEKDQKYICLKDNVNIRKLKEQFRWTLSYAMLKVFNRVSVKSVVSL